MRTMALYMRWIAVFCTLTVAVVLLVSGVSKVLWCHYFERVLYQYQLALPAAWYKVIRAYMPMLETGLGLALAIRGTRVLALYASVALFSAFIVVQSVTVLRGIHTPCGCFGPFADGALSILTIVRTLVLCILACMAIILYGSRRVRAYAAASTLGVLVICLMFSSGCDSGVHQRHRVVATNSVATRTTPVTVAEAGDAPRERRVTGITDNVLKGMDDFSAALGLQYARLSYDTNRYLLNYTNIVRALPDDEFIDLLRDFLLARCDGCSAEELACYRRMIVERASNLWERSQYDSYAQCLMYMAASLQYDHNAAAAAGLFGDACNNVAALGARAVDDQRAEAALLSMLDAVVLGCAHMRDSTAAETYHDQIARLADLPHLSQQTHFRLRMQAAATLLGTAPEQARKEFEQLASTWPSGLRDTYYVRSKAYADGIAQGLSGKALGEYVLRRLVEASHHRER